MRMSWFFLLFKSCEEPLSALFIHIFFLFQTLSPVLCGKMLFIPIQYLIHKSIGWKKSHIISPFSGYDPMDIGRNFIIFLFWPPFISAGHIGCNKKSTFLWFKYGSGIYLIVLFLCSQQLFVILNRQKCGRKEDTAPAPLHTFCQFFPWIDTEQADPKISLLIQLRIDLIMFIQILMDHEKMRYSKIKFGKLCFHRALFMVIQIIINSWRQTVQCPDKCCYAALILISVTGTVSFQCKKLFVTPVKLMTDPCTVLLTEPLHGKKILLDQGSRIHFPSPFHQIVCLIYQKDIILLNPFCKKPLQVYMRIK